MSSQDFDFTAPKWDRDDKTLARVRFSSHVQRARQIVYDVGRSEPMQGDPVQRHADSSEPYHRFQLGMHLALVYLVSQLDSDLGGAFRTLWSKRRDMLESWVADKFGGHPSSDEDGDLQETRSGSRSRGVTVQIPLPFADVWSPSTDGLTLEEFVRGKVLAVWDGVRVKKKIEVLMRRILKDVEPPAEQCLEKLYLGLDHRNRFAHPRPHTVEVAPKRPPLVVQHASEPELTDDVFKSFCSALLDFLTWLDGAVNEALAGWVATNVKRFRDALSDKQLLAIGAYKRDSGEWYKTLDALIAKIEKSEKKGFSPKLLLLAPTDEIVERLADVEALVAKRPSMPLIFFEEPFLSVSPASRQAWLSYLDSKSNLLRETKKKGKVKPPKSDALASGKTDADRTEVGLQRLGSIRVIHDRGYLFDMAGTPILATTKEGSTYHKMIPHDQSYDSTVALRRAIAEVTRLAPNVRGH